MPSERLVQDIEGLPAVLEKIFAANGCTVSGEDVRSGHREQRHDGTGPLHTEVVAYEITSERIVSFSVLSTLTLKHLIRLLLTMIMKTLSILYMTLPAISVMMM